MQAGRTARMGTLAAAYSAVVLAGVIALAVISARHPWRLDLTRDRHQSLSSETHRILASIPREGAPIEMMAVTSHALGGNAPGEAERQVRPLLELFRRESRQRITTRVVMAEEEPAYVQGLAVDKMPMIILRWTPPGAPSGEPPRERRTDLITEHGVAQALQQIVEGRTGNAYLLIGHGEMQQSDPSQLGYAGVAHVLSGMNLAPHDLLLAGAADVPEDCDLLVLAGPEADLVPEEVEAMRRYAARGGRFLVVHGPAQVAGRYPVLDAWLRSEWGAGTVDGVVADLAAPLGGNLVTLLVPPDTDATHPIVRGFGKMVEVPASRKLVPDPYPPDGVKVDTLLASGPRSWLETDLGAPTPRYDETDLLGPHGLALATARKPPDQAREARLVLLGSRVMTANLFLGEIGNADFVRNVVSWLTGREDDIASRSGSGEDGTVVIALQQAWLILATTLAIPLVVVVAGIATWWWRRRL